MIEIIQNIIDFLTYTPTLYVDGVACEVQGAWIGAAIGVIGSLVGAGMSANASSSSAKKMRKAAQKNYNMLMENAEMSKMTLGEQMDRYEEDMESYKSSMIQRYGLAGGLREETAGLKEVSNYQFGTQEIDENTLRERMEEKRLQNIEDYVSKGMKNYHYRAGSSEAGHEMETPQEKEAKLRAKAEKEFDKNWTDKQVTEALGDTLYDYKGKSTPWDKQEGSIFKSSRRGGPKADSSAILNLQTSVSNMQRDINNAYKAGMIEYWQQRKNAQNVKDTGMFQAAGYSTQAQTTLASGFLSAIQYGAQAYSQYGRSGTGTSVSSYRSGGGVATHQY